MNIDLIFALAIYCRHSYSLQDEVVQGNCNNDKEYRTCSLCGMRLAAARPLKGAHIWPKHNCQKRGLA